MSSNKMGIQLLIIMQMESDHDRIVEQIEKKMVGASMHKSQEEKKQQIFQYGNDEEQLQNFGNYETKPAGTRPIISLSQAEISLEEIYHYYVNSYIQPRKHFQTFDDANERKLTFQPFILFMKNFRLLKVIFPLEKVKLFFKKYSNFGQYLTIQNFIFLINELSHEKEAKDFFNIEQIRIKENLDFQSLQEVERQEMYNYLSLESPQKFKLNFKNVFEPFFCKQKTDTQKIKYTYRKFSQPELLKKSMKPQNNKTEEKQLYVVKNKDFKDIKDIKEVQVEENPFSQVKSIVVSWQSLRSKSLANVQKNSAEIVRKKYLKEDSDDYDYLREYGEKQNDERKRLQKKIDEITKQQASKNKLLLAKLEQKTAQKSSVAQKASKVK